MLAADQQGKSSTGLRGPLRCLGLNRCEGALLVLAARCEMKQANNESDSFGSHQGHTLLLSTPLAAIEETKKLMPARVTGGTHSVTVRLCT